MRTASTRPLRPELLLDLTARAGDTHDRGVLLGPVEVHRAGRHEEVAAGGVSIRRRLVERVSVSEPKFTADDEDTGVGNV